MSTLKIEFGDKLYKYLVNNPRRCDTVFAVGPKKKQVKTMRAILVVSSPVFRKLFKESWDAILARKKPIPLPDLDPDAFQAFIKLVVKDHVTRLILKKMHFSAEVLLNMIEICEKYSMTVLQEKLETLAEKTVFSDLPEFVKTSEFHEMSLKNVKLILSREELTDDSNCDIFQIAWKWCEFECERRGKTNARENVKKTLATCLPHIQMPAVLPSDPKEVEVEINDELDNEEDKRDKILTYANILAAVRGNPPDVFENLSLEDEQFVNYMKKIHWESRRASLIYGPTISFLNRFKFINEPYEGDGQMCTTFFQTDQKVNLSSIGFLGPISEDAFIECWVEILRFKPYYLCYTCGEVYKKIYTRKETLFYVEFDEPVPVEATFKKEMMWDNYYGIRFTIKGADIQNMDLGISPWEGSKPADRTFWFEEANVRFYCELSNNPLVTLSFRR